MRTLRNVVVLSSALVLLGVGERVFGSSDQLPASPLADKDEIAKVAEIFGQPIHFDEQGLIVHMDGDEIDGGDTAQREGWYWLGVWLRNEARLGLEPWPYEREKLKSLDAVLDKLEPRGDGVFVRHPTDPEWNDPHDRKNGTSRDQLEPLIAAMGVWPGHEARILRLWKALPTSVLGKHAFNGEYTTKGVDLSALDILGVAPECSDFKPGENCSPQPCEKKEVKKECPSEPADCSLDLGDCKRTREDCPPRPPRPPCPPRPLPCPDRPDRPPRPPCVKVEFLDPGCKARREKDHAVCLAERPDKLLVWKLEMDRCEAEKLLLQAEAEKKRVDCEAKRTVEMVKCHAESFLAAEFCANTHGHEGDLILPSTINLFRRALKEDPLSAQSKLDFPEVPFPSRTLLKDLTSRTQLGALGEEELELAVQARVYCGKISATDTSDDLNLIVKLLVGRLAIRGNEKSISAGKHYGLERPHTYGSYFEAYIKEYGQDWRDLEKRMKDGIQNKGWKPTTMAHVGAVTWYHRPSKGANPRLADLYRPILEWAFPGPIEDAPTGTGGHGDESPLCKVRGEKD